jgi:hypothetical protein
MRPQGTIGRDACVWGAAPLGSLARWLAEDRVRAVKTTATEVNRESRANCNDYAITSRHPENTWPAHSCHRGAAQ